MSMSTPVSQLPPMSTAPSNVRHDEDQIVADVINEMQTESRPKPGPSVAPTPQVVQQYVLPQAPPSPHIPSYSKARQSDLLFGVIEKEHAIRAGIAALIALALFYPQSFEAFYSKVPKLGPIMEDYDKIIRTALFAIVLYILMWRFNI